MVSLVQLHGSRSLSLFSTLGYYLERAICAWYIRGLGLGLLPDLSTHYFCEATYIYLFIISPFLLSPMEMKHRPPPLSPFLLFTFLAHRPVCGVIQEHLTPTLQRLRLFVCSYVHPYAYNTTRHALYMSGHVRAGRVSFSACQSAVHNPNGWVRVRLAVHKKFVS